MKEQALMLQDSIVIRFNPMQLHTLEAFFQTNGRFTGTEKDVYFVRYLGSDSPGTCRSQFLKEEEKKLAANVPEKAGYYRTMHFPKAVPPQNLTFYANACTAYQQSMQSMKAPGSPDSKLKLYFSFGNPDYDRHLALSFSNIVKLYQKDPKITDSMCKNFAVKCLYWIDQYYPLLFKHGSRLAQSPKFVFHGSAKRQEYLFMYLMASSGCDVLYLNGEADPAVEPELLALSQRRCGAYLSPLLLPEFKPEPKEHTTKQVLSQTPNQVPGQAPSQAPNQVPSYAPNQISSHAPSQVPNQAPNQVPSQDKPESEQNPKSAPDSSQRMRPVNISNHPKHPKKSKQPDPAPRAPRTINSPAPSISGKNPPSQFPANSAAGPASPASAARRELTYEELAGLAPSIVMIGAFDPSGDCIKTGSGVFITDNGCILTNFHVVSNACYYSIRMEDCEQTYETDELLKYHPSFDLAILRIGKNSRPIPLYQSSRQLVRGQKVIAIGSPLGLFNSVSDGIISGFRTIHEVPMIQFTAPTSHGSSGGALLNMCGELIGLCTAGFDDGQNLNLAVDYQTLIRFAHGFIKL